MPTDQRALARLTEGPCTARALAEALGIDIAAARRHLEAHLTKGHVVALFRQEGVGRPRKYYEITRRGRELLPRHYELLAEVILNALAHADRPTVDQIVEEMAEHVATDLRARIPPDGDMHTRVQALVRGLRNLGFPTDLERRGDSLVIRRRDCIFLRAAEAQPDLVCRRFDTRLLELALGSHVDLQACLPEGAPCCRHRISLGSNS